MIVLVLVLVAAIGALVRRRRSRRGAATSQPAPGQSVQAVAHAGPPGPVVIQATGQGVTLTVRVERHPGPSTITIEEMPSR